MATITLLQHYLQYLQSPAFLLAILVVVGPIILEVWKNKVLSGRSSVSSIEGCFRLGLSSRSNLDDQYDAENKASHRNSETKKSRIKALFTYPIKSCQGVELVASEVGATGLKYDRLFTFAQLVSTQNKSKSSSESAGVAEVSEDWNHEWRFITQRDFPRLALLKTELWVPNPRGGKKDSANGKPATVSEDAKPASGGYLVFSFPFGPDFNPFGIRTQMINIYIPLAPSVQRAEEKKYALEQLSIWKDSPQAINVTGEMSEEDLAKLKYFLGVRNPLALFRVDPSNMRNITRSLPEDKSDEVYSVGFADAFPFHILNLASVRALEDNLPAKDRPKNELDARRFRANVYVTGPSAYAEDRWKRVTMGRCIRSPKSKGGKVAETDGEYHVACRTARCKLPNVDQRTGIKDNNEPSTTLSRTRQVDEGAKPHPCLGMQMIPLFQQGILRVGDDIKVLEEGEHHYEKMFS